ncbi:AraC family transcriptional regulator [Aquibium carbonis]|uniref:AraC family transcriptional regulator n=1 Tax=Aquibium carbonis TaxID=2495581 RepID=A0A429YSD4_9HYPH|nr:AraC family transcriptional regulator [Aquibium carbonis]RST84302.1 AraC family transcriptional regulator [Aquibium carbonis]
MRYAFREIPSQARIMLPAVQQAQSSGVIGVEEGWDVAFVMWRAPVGFDVSVPAVDHVTISILDEGPAFMRMDGPWRGRSGGKEADAFLLYPGGYDRRWIAPGDTTGRHHYLDLGLIAEAARELGRTDEPDLREDRVFAHDAELRLMLDQYVRRGIDPVSRPSSVEMDLRALLIAMRLVGFHAAGSGGIAAPRVGALSPRRLRMVVDAVEAWIDEEVSLDRLASVAGLGKYHFATAFRQATGLTPHRFVTLRRIDRAKAALAGRESITTIALACGFASHQHFTTAFRRETGTTPSEWRRQFARA